jgi:hypothetical protein
MQENQSLIKAVFAFILLATALYSGYTGLPLWSIPLLGLLFLAGYIHGKWYLWKPMFQAINSRFWGSLLVTWLIQCIVVLVLYLIAAGVRRVIG